MASKFVVPDREQSFFQATSYRELLAGDELVWTVIEVVEGLDLSSVYARYGVDVGQGGRPAFGPAMMLTLVVFGYCEGKRSARELEAACRRDVAYQAICGGMIPDHSTIARFRVLIDDVIESLFMQVLEECRCRGLVDVGRVALDGTKMQAAASKGSNRTAGALEELRGQVEAILTETRLDPTDNPTDNPTDDDTDPDDGGGDGGGDDDGDGDSDGGGGWSQLRRERETQRRLGRIEGAQAEVERSRLRREHDEKRRGRTRGGQPSGNLTDPDSRLQKSPDGGFIQGYNTQAVVSGDQIVVAVAVSPETTDVGQFRSMVERTMTNLAAIGAGPPRCVLADAGYWSLANSLVEDTLEGTTLLIAPGDKSHRVGAPPSGLGETASDAATARHAMATRLADPAHHRDYQQRSWLIEGCFAHTKTHRRTSRFSRRGLAACQAEWTLIHLAGNIRKIHQARCSRPPGPQTPLRPPKRVPTGGPNRYPHHRQPNRPRPSRPTSITPNPVLRHFPEGGVRRSREGGAQFSRHKGTPSAGEGCDELLSPRRDHLENRSVTQADDDAGPLEPTALHALRLDVLEVGQFRLQIDPGDRRQHGARFQIEDEQALSGHHQADAQALPAVLGTSPTLVEPHRQAGPESASHARSDPRRNTRSSRNREPRYHQREDRHKGQRAAQRTKAGHRLLDRLAGSQQRFHVLANPVVQHVRISTTSPSRTM
jgi:transposase